MKTKASLKQLILAVSVSLLAFPLISTVAFAKSQGDKRGEQEALLKQKDTTQKKLQNNAEVY